MKRSPETVLVAVLLMAAAMGCLAIGLARLEHAGLIESIFTITGLLVFTILAGEAWTRSER